MDHVQQVLWGGLLIGLVFGAVGQLSGFCLMSGLRDWWVHADGRRIRAFALALAVAVLGAQWLDAAGLVNLQRSIYMPATLAWPQLLLGGLLFGYGMVLANGCGARSLVLLGGGNLRSFVVLVCLGLAAYAVLSGVLAPVRTWSASLWTVTPDWRPTALRGLLAAWGAGDALARWLPALLVTGALGAFALASGPLRRSPRDWLGGVLIGALVPAGWWVTGHLGADDFDPLPVASLTFIAPIGEGLQYLMLATGMSAGFGLTVIAGVALGSLVVAVPAGRFRLQGFDSPQRMLRYMAGGALMGAGGALALGCSIGQGLTGLSTLAAGSFVASAGILAGAALGLRGPLRAAPV